MPPKKTKTATKKTAPKKTLAKKTEEPVIDIHIPAEKEIKKRNLLLFIILVLLVGFIFFISNNITTNQKFNLAQNELSALQTVVNSKEGKLNDKFNQVKTSQAKLTEALAEEVNRLQQVDQTLSGNIQDVNSQIATINATIDYMEAVNEALIARDTELNDYIEDFYAEMLEQKITANNFLMKMYEKQIEYLDDENKALLKTKFEAMELTSIPEAETEEIEETFIEPVATYNTTEETNEETEADNTDTEE